MPLCAAFVSAATRNLFALDNFAADGRHQYTHTGYRATIKAPKKGIHTTTLGLANACPDLASANHAETLGLVERANLFLRLSECHTVLELAQLRLRIRFLGFSCAEETRVIGDTAMQTQKLHTACLHAASSGHHWEWAVPSRSYQEVAQQGGRCASRSFLAAAGHRHLVVGMSMSARHRIHRMRHTVSTRPFKVHPSSQSALRSDRALHFHAVFWWCLLHRLGLKYEACVSPLCD